MANPYDIVVYDTRPDGHGSLGPLPRLHEEELDRLQAFYKFELDFTHGYEQAQPGQLFWRLHGFELKAGPAILQPMVWDEDGQKLIGPEHNIALFLHWPGTEPLPQGFEPRYEETAIIGFTKGSGDVGWGFGAESHIGPDGGPFVVWASADPVGDEWPEHLRRVGSDAIRKLGWWDDHIIPNPIFQVMRKAGTPAPIGDEYLINMVEGIITGYIAFVPGAPPDGQRALGLMRNGVLVGHIPWL